MKKLITLLFLICSVQILSAQALPFSQPARVDSLKHALQTTANDTLRLVLINRIQHHYFLINTNFDSALFYSRQLLQLTRKLNYKIDEAYALDLVGSYMNFLLNSQTLKTLFEGVRIAEDARSEKNILPERYLRMMIYWSDNFSTVLAKNQWNPKFFRLLILASLYNDLGGAYGSTISNQQKLLYYSYKAIHILESCNDLSDLSVTYYGIANYFASTNQYDSCLRYAQKSYDLAKQTNSGFAPINLGIIGTMYFKKGNFSEAVKFCRMSIQTSSKSPMAPNWAPYHTIAEYFFEKGITDSSLYYSRKAFEQVKIFDLPADVQKVSVLLAKVYKARGNADSATKYYELALSYDDIINNIDKKRILQSQDVEEQLRQQEVEAVKNRIKVYSLLAGLGLVLIIAVILLINNRQRKKTNSLLQQKNQQIESTLQELKSTQAQLIQSEKMASLGELTAGIAHEIQNPLNFVNNFSDVNKELIEEMKQEIDKGDIEEVKAIANDIEENEVKINHHGKRADAIVKGMLQHSRASTGKKEPTDINALADEYLRLSYHGLRAKDKDFNANFKTNFDESIGRIEVVPQDIGRVLLNLYNNAFYAVNEKKKAPTLKGENYEPTVWVTTKRISSPLGAGGLEISVKDNGVGIPQKILDKIFQPFFTTKPTGQGTGLGLSLSYDIIKAHGGEMKVETKEGDGAEFIIELRFK